MKLLFQASKYCESHAAIFTKEKGENDFGARTVGVLTAIDSGFGD
jgi:hypothetical protein